LTQWQRHRGRRPVRFKRHRRVHRWPNTAATRTQTATG